ncbi:MAG: trypsin-like peptidase domain-containing protein [Acidobacteria bacterium]|nr:trypsin-like peptidase domain-containing protein [Acidobacteriota bacterium]
MARAADKIAEMLADYNPLEIDEALALMRDGRPVPQPSAYDIDVGSEVGVGEEGRVELSELALVERIIEANNLLPVHFLTEGAALQGAVGKVVVSPPGWSGTGFMVSPSLFMTNNHVIRNETDADNARVKLNYQFDHNGNDQQVDEYQADPASFFHTSPSLDYTIVRLEPKARIQRISRGPLIPAAAAAETLVEQGAFERVIADGGDLGPGSGAAVEPTVVGRIGRIPPWWLIHAGAKWGFIPLRDTIAYAPGQRLNVIQHPRGRRKEVALQSNTVTNIFTNHVRYSTDTEPGSSGSPVLNNSWDLVAIHHAAGSQDGTGDWLDNQGVRIDKIVADLRSQLLGSTTGQAVLSELGI